MLCLDSEPRTIIYRSDLRDPANDHHFIEDKWELIAGSLEDYIRMGEVELGQKVLVSAQPELSDIDSLSGEMRRLHISAGRSPAIIRGNILNYGIPWLRQAVSRIWRRLKGDTASGKGTIEYIDQLNGKIDCFVKDMTYLVDAREGEEYWSERDSLFDKLKRLSAILHGGEIGIGTLISTYHAEEQNTVEHFLKPMKRACKRIKETVDQLADRLLSSSYV